MRPLLTKVALTWNSRTLNIQSSHPKILSFVQNTLTEKTTKNTFNLQARAPTCYCVSAWLCHCESSCTIADLILLSIRSAPQKVSGWRIQTHNLSITQRFAFRLFQSAAQTHKVKVSCYYSSHMTCNSKRDEKLLIDK